MFAINLYIHIHIHTYIYDGNLQKKKEENPKKKMIRRKEAKITFLLVLK